jgi:fructan beta-fructosidase
LLKLHIFVDCSSVEVFANDGEKVMTDRVYPPPGSDGIELYSRGSGGKVLSLKIWQIESIWTAH